MRILRTKKDTIIKTAFFFGLGIFLNSMMPSYAETKAITTFGQSQTIPDDILLNNVQSTTADKLRAKGVKVTLSVQSGVIILKGVMPTADDAVALVEQILSLQGVIDVDTNQLTVADKNPNLSDLLITARVKGTLIREKFFGTITSQELPIQVHTKDGIVYLEGIVDNQSQLINIIRGVQAMRSIPRVISLLQIRTITVNVH